MSPYDRREYAKAIICGEQRLVPVIYGSIMLLKTTGLLYKIVDRELGKVDPSCGRPNFSISPPFIWIPIAIFIGPMVLAIIGMVSAKVFFFSNDGNSGAAN